MNEEETTTDLIDEEFNKCDYIDQLKNQLKQESNNKIQFELLTNIIALESETPEYKSFIYVDIKTWLNLYLQVVIAKKFGYDEMIHKKVISKFELLPYDHQIKLIDFFIRLLNKEYMSNEIDIYKQYKKEVEVKLLHQNNKFFLLLIKMATLNIFNLVTSFIFSIIFFAFIWHTINILSPNYLGINAISYYKYDFINYVFNIIDLVFNIQPSSIDKVSSLFFIISIKLYFYIFITYFVIQKISEKVEKL